MKGIQGTTEVTEKNTQSCLRENYCICEVKIPRFTRNNKIGEDLERKARPRASKNIFRRFLSNAPLGNAQKIKSPSV